MSIDVRLSRFPQTRMLNDNGILKAIEKKKIVLHNDISDDQIQPGSLDMRIGATYIFDDGSREIYSREMMAMTSPIAMDNYEPSREHAKFYPDQKDIPIWIPSMAQAEIYFHERMNFVNDMSLSYELRTSRGRLALKPWSNYPETDIGGIYVSLTNVNPNPLILYGQSKFANLFFNMKRKIGLDHGKTLVGYDAVAKAMPDFAKQRLITPEGYLVFRLGKHAKTFKKGKVIDTAKEIDDSYYDTHDLSIGYFLPKDTPAIVELGPKVSLPANMGIMLVHRVPFHSDMQQYGFAFADSNQLNAGWVDQGFNGNLTAHPVYFMMPRLLREGDVFCFGKVYKYNSKSRRSYGDSSLGSHYQNSSGATTSRS